MGFEKLNRSIDCWVVCVFAMGRMSRSCIYLGIMAVVLLSVCGPARGADSSVDITCAAAIIPCQADLNTTVTPASTCCTPLLNEYDTERACLCSLLSNSILLNQVNISITQAIGVASRCGLNINSSTCSDLEISPTPSESSPPPPPPPQSAASSPFSEKLPLLVLFLLGVVAQVYQ